MSRAPYPIDEVMSEYGLTVIASNYFKADWDILAELSVGTVIEMIVLLFAFAVTLAIVPGITYLVYWGLDDTVQGKMVGEYIYLGELALFVLYIFISALPGIFGLER